MAVNIFWDPWVTAPKQKDKDKYSYINIDINNTKFVKKGHLKDLCIYHQLIMAVPRIFKNALGLFCHQTPRK